ncbi:MAG: ABC transporter permease, partial [Lachnospiraceae bacterium]|nr:ABC transporter permease [Lachnospiraceae bacterium]
IDMFNLAFALDRLALFKSQHISATGSLTFLQYGIASGSIFFLLLIGMACYPMMQPYPDALRRQLKRSEIGIGRQCFGKWLCGLCSMTLSSLFFLFLIKGIMSMLGYSAWLPEIGLRQMGTAVIILICIATFIFMIFQIANSGSTAILILFFISTLMIYFSGGIMPSAFLPKAVQSIGKILPTTYLIEAVGSMYLGGVKGKTIGILILYTFVFGAASYGIRRRGSA